MPTYEYECEACHRVFEVRQRITEDPLTTCETCGGKVRRLLSAAPFILKGEGWYVTDYPSESRKKAMQSEKSSSSSSESSSKSDGAKSDGAKSDGASTSSSSSSSSSTSSGASSSASPKSD